MNLAKSFYVKSLETDLATQRLEDGVKKQFQAVEDMVEGEKIKPNTVSFGQADRLACTVLSTEYTKTYRPQGIIFQTELQPDYIAPFDLMVLANVPGEKIQADYYSIVDNLKEHYGRALIPGYEDFLFHSPEELFAAIPNSEVAWEKVNQFRQDHGLSPVPEAERKLVFYNEVIFHREVPMKPIALFGDPEIVPELNERAKSLGLKVYPTAENFYETIEEMRREQRKETAPKIK